MNAETPPLSREERKESLKRTAEKSIEAIQDQLGDLKKVGTNALIIGGVIVAGYSLTSLLLPTKDRLVAKQIDENEEESVLWAGAKGIAMSLLLALAKEKLVAMIKDLSQKDSNPDAA